MKLFAIGLWVALVALGTAYGAALFLPAPGSTPKVEAPLVQYTKTRVLNVPMIASGVVQGFMAVQLGFTVDVTTLKSLTVPPEVYLLDEAFRTVYTDGSLDFKNISKYDLKGFTSRLLTATNDRLGAPIIKDVLIEQFSYIGKELAKNG